MLRTFRRTRLMLAVLLVACGVLITLDFRAGHGSPLTGVRSVAGAALGPIETGIAAGTRPLTRTVSGVTRGARASARADRLARENAVLRQQLLLARRPSAADPVRGLLALAGASRLRIVPARVVGYGAALGLSYTATVDAGSRDGVRPNTGVVTAAGLAGRVTSVSATTATVRLAADPATKVGVRLAGSAEIGVLTGGGAAPMTLDVLNANAVLRIGQLVRTLGSPNARPYPAGLPVGRISKVLPGTGMTARALVTPATRFSVLDLVGVVLSAPRVIPRQAVAPAKPDPVVSLPPSTGGAP